jgi:SNF2 family DNA or RNA helicase
LIEIDASKFRSKPFAHQLEGVRKLVKNPSFALFDEMGAGKSKQVVDAACVLSENMVINCVVVLAPASVRRVWLSEDDGEIKKHSWVPSIVYDNHAKIKLAWQDDDARLLWVVTNYELLRQKDHLNALADRLVHYKALLVLDESSYIKSRTASQTKAAKELRKMCDRAVLLNGTPITNNPLDLWAQFLVLDEEILKKRYHSFMYFRSEYAEMGGWHGKKVIKWRRLDKLQKILAPHILRRLKEDCLDLPPKLYTQREVPLSVDTWRRYKDMREDCIMNLSPEEKVIEPNAAVRIMRLCQLTSGHASTLGIITAANEQTVLPMDHIGDNNIFEVATPENRALSSEKIDWCVDYLTSSLCDAKYVIVWTRFRYERERLIKALLGSHTIFYRRICQIYGGQKAADREDALKIFAGSEPRLPSVLVAQQQAGGLGLTLTAATAVVYLSNDWNLGVRLQSEDRCHRPGQTRPVTYIDVLATGPKGQKTIDHTIVKALRSKQSLAEMTTAAWRSALKAEEE